MKRRKESLIRYLSTLAIFILITIVWRLLPGEGEIEGYYLYDVVDGFFYFIIVLTSFLFGLLCAIKSVYLWFVSPVYVVALSVGVSYVMGETEIGPYIIDLFFACLGMVVVVLSRKL
jgi:hypothetical protein